LLFLAAPCDSAIIVSGDGNIANALDGSSGAGIDAGNKQFYQNLLQGGTAVAIHSDTDTLGSPSLNAAIAAMNNFYNSLGGVSSSTFAGNVTAAQLSGVDLFISMTPDNAFTAAEITAMSNLLGGGGSILFMGDNANFAPQNNRINAAVSALGGSMTILSTSFDSGFHTAVGGQIAVDPFTAGVNTFTYAAPSELMVTGGTPLFFGTGGQQFVAYEQTATNVIPEPTTVVVWSLLAALGLAAGWRRRRRS